jgi:hypothetical protein
VSEPTPDDWSPGEPLPTGFVQIALSGDRILALSHLRDARRLLGHLRAVHGIDARIAAGEAGGFFKRTVSLTDGTRVTVASNDGQDTVRIDAPGRVVQVAPTVTGAPAAPVEQGETALPRPQVEVSHLPPVVPVVPQQTRQEDDTTVDEETVEYRPYLWIGVRILNRPDDASHAIHACLWEPAAEAGGDWQILSNRNALGYGGFDSATYPLRAWTQFTSEDIAYTDQHLFMLLPENGYPMRVPDFNPAIDDDVEWDVIFISDSENDLQLIADGAPMIGTGSGTYYLKLMVTGPDCRPGAGEHYPPQEGPPYSPVEVEIKIITGKDRYRTDAQHKVTISEFTTCASGVVPFGYFPPSRPDDDNCYGPNPHAPHWWQGMAEVQLAPVQMGVPEDQLARSTTRFSRDGEVELPPTGFEPGSWPDMCVFHPAIIYKQPFRGASCDFQWDDDQTFTDDPFNDTVFGMRHYTMRMRTLKKTTTVTFDQYFAQNWENGGYGPPHKTTTQNSQSTESGWELVFDNTINWDSVTFTGIDLDGWPDWVMETWLDWLQNSANCPEGTEAFMPTGPMTLVPY